MRQILLCSSLTLLLAGSIAEAQTAQPRPQRQAPVPVAGGVDKQKKPAGGIEVLSDTRGVEFKPYFVEVQRITKSSLQPLVPAEVNAPVFLAGEVMIRFKILPDGHVMDDSMVLEGRSGHTDLDRAAWGAITSSEYPPLPEEFKGPFIEIRFAFLFNPERKPLTEDKPADSNEPAPDQAPEPTDAPADSNTKQ
jgi:TonB family protein